MYVLVLQIVGLSDIFLINLLLNSGSHPPHVVVSINQAILAQITPREIAWLDCIQNFNQITDRRVEVNNSGPILTIIFYVVY